MPRELLEETATYRRYRVTTDTGALIGYDAEEISSAQQLNERTLRDRAAQAFSANRTYLARPDSEKTAALVRAQVNALTQQNNALIRLILQNLDSAD